MNQTTIATGIVALVLGYIGGTVLQTTPSTTSDHQSMQHMMDDMTLALKGKTGSELDKAFLEEMIPHHQGAVEMARMIQTGSQNAELLTMAEAIITTQNQEIDQMNAWLKTWFVGEHEGMGHTE